MIPVGGSSHGNGSPPFELTTATHIEVIANIVPKIPYTFLMKSTYHCTLSLPNSPGGGSPGPPPPGGGSAKTSAIS